MYGNLDINYYTVLHGLSEADQLDVWSWILGKHVGLNQLTTSPFRPDQHPFCKLRAYNGIIFFTDFAFPEFSKFTCIHGIEFFRRKGLNEAASFIYTNMYFGKRPVITHNVVQTGITLRGRPSKTEIHFIPFVNENKEACFTNGDKEYWENTGVNVKDLKEANVFSVHHFYINGTKWIPKYYPVYAYVMPSGKIKIYQPYEIKANKWFSTTNKNDIWEFNIDKTKLLITKSLKDALIIKNILTDYTIHAYQNEGVVPDYDYSNFESIHILYDKDAGGINGANRVYENIENSNKHIIFFDTVEKDAYEICKSKGLKRLKKELKRLL